MFLVVVVVVVISLLSLSLPALIAPLSLFADEYKMKGVEEVKYMRRDENRVNARNQENLVRHAHARAHTHTHTFTRPLTAHQTHTGSDLFLTVYQLKRTSSCLCPKAAPSASHIRIHCLLHTCKYTQKHTKRCLTLR